MNGNPHPAVKSHFEVADLVVDFTEKGAGADLPFPVELYSNGRALLTPDEARKLSNHLRLLADEADRVLAERGPLEQAATKAARQ